MHRCFALIGILFIPVYLFSQSQAAVDSLEKPLFYIAGVTDSRIVKSIDKLPVGNAIKNAVISEQYLPLEDVIQFFVNNELPRDSTLIPVFIDIRQFEVTGKDSAQFSKREFALRFNYQLKSTTGKTDFAFFSFKRDLYKYMKTPAHYADILKKEIATMVQQLNGFIRNSLNSFPYRGIIVKAQVDNKKNSIDTIYYDNKRQLQWNDFKGNPDDRSLGTAQTTSAFLYSMQSTINDGYLIVDVSLECYFLKRRSWVKQSADWGRLLEHEQLHFDITNLSALKLRDAIGRNEFPLNGWQSVLAKLNTEYFNEMSIMQSDYDNESDHGRNEIKQLEWQKRIHDLLAKSPL